MKYGIAVAVALFAATFVFAQEKVVKPPTPATAPVVAPAPTAPADAGACATGACSTAGADASGGSCGRLGKHFHPFANARARREARRAARGSCG